MEIQPDIVKMSAGASVKQTPAVMEQGPDKKSAQKEILWIALMQIIPGALLCLASLSVVNAETLQPAAALFLLGSVLIALGICLYMLKKWAWWVSVVLYSLSVLGNLVAIANGEKHVYLILIPLALVAALVSKRKAFL